MDFLLFRRSLPMAGLEMPALSRKVLFLARLSPPFDMRILNQNAAGNPAGFQGAFFVYLKEAAPD
ncbi:MAG: hypothetical protein DBX55_05655 [Verrucomicrobia bacterium]|nr:MAG: hypothetical protein DBX55_05655 [Verrucomicrobiota bacterium]